ncbi:WD40 repeat domain-containing protein [Dapis sp. BLCC M126]|uniref:WD40 repeat domain-containing protein n=1 Tax=Dapis sp. BLCC M126 TaxID=3400189 RepID=UPI003CF0324F
MPEKNKEVYSIAASKLLGTHNTEVYSLTLSPNSKILVGGSTDGEIKLWDFSTVEGISNQNLVRIMKHYCRHNSDDDSDRFDSNSSCLEKTNTAKTNSGVHTIAISKNGKWLASGGYDLNIKIWNFDSQKQMTNIKSSQGSIKKLIFSYDANFLVSSSGYTDDSLGENNTVKIWRPHFINYKKLGQKEKTITTS